MQTLTFSFSFILIMYAILFLCSLLTPMRASLVDTASSVDFYPLSPHSEIESTESAGEGRCKKECLNEGSCVVDDNGSEACSCQPTFSGEYCQHEGEACGGGFCQHSSTCLELSLEEEPFVEHMCDCTNAYTEDTYYAGEFCQYPSTQLCSGSDDPNGRQFCVNGGQCPGESHLPCICPEGYSGPRCAFQIGVDERDYDECDISCQNGGTCQKGTSQTKQKEFMRNFANADFSGMLSENPERMSFEHCVCPPGYFGIHCEYQMEQCGNGEHLCFHGSTCTSNEGEFSCDCFSSKMKTAGLFCEYVASSECEQWVDVTNGHRGFCTNGGHCEVNEYGVASCMCPSGYIGEHCEYRLDIHDDPFQSSNRKEHKGARGIYVVFEAMLITVAVVVGLLLLVVMIVAFRPFRQRTLEAPASERTVDTTTMTTSCHDGIILDNNMEMKGGEGNERGEYNLGERGFSSVELL